MQCRGVWAGWRGRFELLSPTSTFTVTGLVTVNGTETVTSTITYTVGKAAGGIKTVSRSSSGLTFKLGLPATCVAPSAGLHVTLSQRGSSRRYHAARFSFYIGRGKPHRKRVGKHELTVYGPNVQTTHAGPSKISLSGVRSGTQQLRLIIHLSGSHVTPATKTLTITSSFSVC